MSFPMFIAYTGRIRPLATGDVMQLFYRPHSTCTVPSLSKTSIIDLTSPIVYIAITKPFVNVDHNFIY
jgi:hypothetical protein